MGTKAKWGPKSFLVSPRKIVPFEGFKSSVTMKADSENDTSGTAPTNTRGRELQPFSCSTTYYAAAGNDPMAEYDSWVDLLGMYYPLYLGDRRFGPAEMFQLKSINMDETRQADDGTVISVTLSFSFTEYSEGKSSKLASTSGGGKGITKPSATYDATGTGKQAAYEASKKEALATAAAAERQNKKLAFKEERM